MVFFYGRFNRLATKESTLINDFQGIFPLKKKQEGYFNTNELLQWTEIFNSEATVETILELLIGESIIHSKNNIINAHKLP